MNVLILFRGNNISAAIANSAKAKIENDKIKDLHISITNIEKINIKNYFSKMEILPDVIYVFISENEIIDWLKENYPNIKYFIYDKNNFVFYENHRYGNTRKYSLNSSIVEDFKNNLQKKIYWIVNTHSLTIKKEELDNIDLKYLKRDECEFETKKLANDFLKSKIQNEITNCDDNIIYYNNEIVKEKKRKKLLEKKLEKLN